MAAPPAAPGADSGLPSLAQLGLKEGDTITAENVREFESYLSPGMVWGVLYGWNLSVIEPKRVEMPRLYREATERYSSQVRLGPGSVTLENYIAGQPFPHVDANDPDAVMKIMWNYYYNPYITDDYDARYFDADTGSVGRGHNMSVERHYIIDHLRRLHFNGRLEVDPKPEIPNSEGFRYKESLHPLIEPFDLKGVGFTAYRYLDPARQDDTWLYLPQLRRVRRMSSAQRSDALFGQDIDVDTYYGYNGHIAWNNYRLLGEQVVLGAMHTRNVPVKWQEPEDWFFEDVWEPRPVYVIEATSKLPQYAYGRRVFYLDRQGFIIHYSDIYDHAGQLWKIYASQHAFKKAAIPGAKVSVYEDDRPFVHAVVTLDTQLAHATKAAIPSTKSRGEECVFFNMGDKTGVTEEWFSVAHLIESGH